MTKIRAEVLHERGHYIPSLGERVDADGEINIGVKVVEQICPICSKVWHSVYLNGCVVFGGESATSHGDKFVEHCGCYMTSHVGGCG